MDPNEAKWGQWLVDLIEIFKPSDVEVDGTPEEMTSKASWAAFTTSTLAGIPPGPIGMLTIIPELAAITKIQIDLVYKIAKYYKKEQQVTKEVLLHILATAFGIVLGRKLLQKIGTRLIVKALTSQTIKALVRKLGVRIAQRALARLGGRYIIFISAPVFGMFSKMQTVRVGRMANEVLSHDIDFEKTIKCSKGHDVSEESKFCPECGEKINPGEETV